MTLPGEGLQLNIRSETLERVGAELPTKSFKFVGHIMDEFLSWDYHIGNVQSKIACGNYAIARTKHTFPLNIRIILYSSLVRPHLEYGVVAWGGARRSKLKKVMNIQKKCIRNVADRSLRSHSDPIFSAFKIMKLDDLFRFGSHT